MELIRLNEDSHPLHPNGAVAVSGFTKGTWVERYRGPGEFSVEGPIYSGLLEQLPVGGLVSTTGSLEPMVVENHELKDSTSSDPVVKISGRSLDALLDYRVVGRDVYYDGDNTTAEIVLSSDTAHEQASALMARELTGASNDVVPNLVVSTWYKEQGLPVKAAESRVATRGTLTSAVKALLEVDDAGLKAVRPHTFSSAWDQYPTNYVFYIHHGRDLTDTVGFSYASGELESTDYFWSDKARYTAALVVGSNITYPVNVGPETGFDRRVLMIDGSDIDQDYEPPITGGTLTTLQGYMQTRAEDQIGRLNYKSIARVDISRRARFQYQEDYELGDIVNVFGNYGITQQMRVTEFVRTFDPSGNTAYPTLTSI